jgi:hypothetical protein
MLNHPRCIYQDNRKDWEIEASRMKDVYRNAAFCIAATAAKDGNHGLFYERDPRSVHPVKINMSWSMALHLLASKHTNGGQGFMAPPPVGPYLVGCHYFDTDTVIWDAPLNKRGW